MISHRVAMLLVGLVLFSSQGKAADLANYGLDSLVVQSDEAGNEVRGMSASAGYSGLSLVAGVLFDPGTGSVATINSVNRAGARSDGVGTPVSAVGETAAAMNYGWNVNGLQAQISGFALGLGVARVGFR